MNPFFGDDILATRHKEKRAPENSINTISGTGSRVSELESLLEISLLLNSTLCLEEVIQIIIDQGMRVVQAEAGTLWLVDEDRDMLVPFVARGSKSRIIKRLFLNKGEGIAGQVVASGEPILVSDVKKDKRWAPHFDQVSVFKTKSILCVPLTKRGKVLGCLELVNKRARQFFTENDLRLCTAFAAQASVVVENSSLYTNQERFIFSLIRTLSSALDARDKYTRGHSERVRIYSLWIADAMGMDHESKQAIERATLLHDIGKIGVSDRILLHDGPLNPSDWLVMRQHPVIGASIVDEMEPKHFLREIREGVLYHHERFDGSGYPFGLRGEEIPLVARVLAVADAFDAITTDRPYRKGKSIGEALDELQKCAGKQLDPALVDLFQKLHRQKG